MTKYNLKTSLRYLLPAVCLALLVSCDASEPKTGAETHFMKVCQDDPECGGTFSCVCGVCTTNCDDAEICGAISSANTCLSTELESLTSCSNTGEPESRICSSSGSCCTFATMPGHFGNPTCFEGATCCGDGQWVCNDGQGEPDCVASVGIGTVCAL